MKPYVTFGLAVGVAALIVVIPISALAGICGPVIMPIAGAIAGFLSAYFGKAPTPREGAQSGVLAGGFAGGGAVLGQVTGVALSLVFAHLTGTQTLNGQAPTPASPISEVIPYYAGGLGAGLCFGIFGLFLAAIAGGLSGAFGTRPMSATPPTPVLLGGDQHGPG